MSNLFASLTVYGKWNVIEEAKLDAEDKALFSKAKVVNSDFGKSVCFFLSNGSGVQYIPMSTEGEQLSVEVNLDAISIQVLAKPGEKNILRAKINAL